jgi:hypothetical protein
MSYDIQIWSVRRVDIEAVLGDLTSWKADGDLWVFDRRGWQITVGTPDEVLAEDIPEDVSATLPGIRYLTELHLSPITASTSARKMLESVAKSIAKISHGVYHDCQTDELVTPKGVKRFIPVARNERFSLLELNWWFLNDDVLSRDGLSGLLDIFESLLPEALPRRYGLYEPPQHQLAALGRDHLLDFLVDNHDDSPVLYPTRPIMGLYVSFTRWHLDSRLGFRANRLSVECESTALDQPGWEEGLRRFWIEVSLYLKPFFSDVRTLNGYLRMGPTYGSDLETEVHPVRSWFWRGIPKELGHAAALGSPYIELWPEAAGFGRRHHELIILDSGSWTDGNKLEIKAPRGISQAWTPGYKNERGGWSVNWVEDYPEIWPFDR